ncbi:YceI family protein [Iamia sp. SCSIO 61187]|uniref:YceI family protein n=1 Tax=Iamia sp. SCSIO 61187 TaxID=2722752 RepID=UPI001C62FF76|nr:YceI family protein [Iamia sp. SCSIO 61187]QYG91140.1 YceI family protein [Iamia sp. SCSIO 61187]
MTDTAPTTTLPLAPGTWTLDAAHTSVGFTIKRLGLAKVRGMFTDVRAELVVGDTLAATSLTATIDLASVDTGNPDRDAHLRSPDLIDVAVRPTIAYRSTAITGEGEDWTVEGELTIGDVTRPHTLEVSFGGVALFPPDGRLHAAFETTTEVRRKDFGLGFGAMGAALGATVKVDIDIELVGPEAAT